MRKLSAVLFVFACCLRGDEFLDKVRLKTRPHHGQSHLATGPGVKLMESFFDYGSNGGVLTNLHDYGDGTLAVGRMGAASSDLIDRGTFFSFFNGTTWSPMAKIEQARRGWSSIAALHDGRSVSISESGI
jgi:hypothetical protein